MEIDPHETGHSRNVLGKGFVLPEPNQLRVLYPFFGRRFHGDRPTARPLDEFHVEDLREAIQVLDEERCDLCERESAALLCSDLDFCLKKDCLG